MSKGKILFLLVTALLLFNGSIALADEEGQDYGYWCTDCGRQHGPGESCPKSSSPSGGSSQDEPYDWSQPVYAPAVTTTTVKTFAQFALEYNAEGEDLYRRGEYQKAYMKFWTARFNDSSNPLFEENLNKAERARDQEDKEKADFYKRMQTVHKRLKSIIIYDPFLVDVRFKPAPKVSTTMPQPKPQTKAQPKPQPVYQPTTPSQKADEVIIALLFLVKYRVGSIPFEQNPEFPWINPLREPERYKAWEKQDRERIQAEINQQRAQAIINAMAKDRRLTAARDQIVKDENRTNTREQQKLMKAVVEEFYQLRAGQPVKSLEDLNKKMEADSALKQKSEAIAADYVKKSDDAKASAGEQSLKKMDEEVTKFFKRHPELKN
jgi:uncharacterized protein YkwD